MEKITLVDDGCKYIWKNPDTGKKETIEYGSFLIKMIYLRKENFIRAYMDVAAMKEVQIQADSISESDIPEEWRELDKRLDEDLVLYKDEIANFEAEELERYIVDALLWGIDDDVLGMMNDSELFIIMEAIADDIHNISGATSIKAIEKKVPQFLYDAFFLQDIKSFLLEEKNDKAGKRAEELLSRYFRGITLNNGVYFDKTGKRTCYNIAGLVQLVMLEIFKVEESKDVARFKVCPVCGRVYREIKKKGGSTSYCNYQYPSGTCREKAMAERENGKSGIDKVYKTHCNAINKFCNRHFQETGMYLLWIDEYKEWHEKVMTQVLTLDEYEALFKQWYDQKKKSIKKK